MVKRVVCIVLILLGMVWILSFSLSPDGVQSRIFQHVFTPWFGDFFINRVIWNAPCPYEGFGMTPAHEVIYPLFAHWVLTFFPNSFFGGMIHSVTGSVFLLFSLSVFLWRRMGNVSLWFRVLMLSACFCSQQMFYVFERSNQVIFAVGMVVLFLAWYDSTRVCERCLAAFALAVAAALKVSPALFGLFYFVPMFEMDRRQVDWFSISLCAVSAAVLIFGPFWWHGEGFVEIERLCRNVAKNGSGTSWGWVALYRELSFVGLVPSGFPFRVVRFANVILGILGLIASVLPRSSGIRTCDRLLFLVSAIMLLPTTSCAYVALYLFPVFLMVDESDWKMCVLWLALFLPLQIPTELILNVSGLTLNPTISNFAFLGLLSMAYCRLVIRICHLSGLPSKMLAS